MPGVSTVVLNEAFEGQEVPAAAMAPLANAALQLEAASAAQERQSLNLPAEIFDLTALASAFVASLSVAPMLAFSYADIQNADQRYYAFWANKTGSLGEGTQVVSYGLSASTSASLALCVVSLIASLVVRMGLHLAEKLATEPMLVVRKLLIPLEVCAVLSLIAGLIVMTFSYYWSGWVVYAENLVGNNNWTYTGVAVIICLIVMSLYAAGVATYIYRGGGKRTVRPLQGSGLHASPLAVAKE